MYEFDWSSIPGALPFLWQGMQITLSITLVATLGALSWGSWLAPLRMSPLRPLSWFAVAYISLFRSIPLVMVLLWFFLIVPQLLRGLFAPGADSDLRVISAMVGFTLFEAAFYAEIIRAGIHGIPRGQGAAARALGMNEVQVMRWVILPQALRNMLPPLLTQSIVLFQDTSLVYVSSLADFFGVAYRVGDRDGRIVELLLFAGAGYFILCYAASRLVKTLQNRKTA